MYVVGYLTARCKQNVDKILPECGSGFRRNIISAPLAVQHESKNPLGLFWLFRPSTAVVEEGPVTPFLCVGIPLTFGGIH